MRRFLRNERGQSIVELALSAPILVMALLGGIDLMRIAAVQQAVVNSSRAGADVVGQNPSISQANVLSVIQGELNGTPGLHDLTVVMCADQTNPVPVAPSPCVVLPPVASGSYTGVLANGTTTCTSNSAGICYVKVRVLYEFHTIVPWWFVPNVRVVDRSTYMPMIS